MECSNFAQIINFDFFFWLGAQNLIDARAVLVHKHKHDRKTTTGPAFGQSD